jgi:hypothetical protein
MYERELWQANAFLAVHVNIAGIVVTYLVCCDWRICGSSRACKEQQAVCISTPPEPLLACSWGCLKNTFRLSTRFLQSVVAPQKALCGAAGPSAALSIPHLHSHLLWTCTPACPDHIRPGPAQRPDLRCRGSTTPWSPSKSGLLPPLATTTAWPTPSTGCPTATCPVSPPILETSKPSLVPTPFLTPLPCCFPLIPASCSKWTGVHADIRASAYQQWLSRLGDYVPSPASPGSMCTLLQSAFSQLPPPPHGAPTAHLHLLCSSRMRVPSLTI